MRPSLGELVDNSLPEATEDAIRQAILSCPGVSDPHNLRTRKIGNRASVEVHIRMNGSMTLNEAHSRTTEVEHSIKGILGNNTFVMIHVEPTK